jgi:hypothetical protein
MTEGVTALEEGRAFVDLSSWWKVAVEGSEAGAWLNDLLSAELDGLEPGVSRRSLLLTPTGRIRASVTVARLEEAFLLIQDPLQPERIDSLLDRYILSSDVRLRDRSDELSLFALPGRSKGSHSPSALGPGADVVAPFGSRPDALSDLVEASTGDVEAWRIRKGNARFPVDLTADSLPHEAEQRDAVAYGKGCFLGQEAVAKVRNLGHPPFVVLAATARGPARAGDVVLSGDGKAGAVTSAAPSEDGATAVIARVRWALKDSQLRTGAGVELSASGLALAA